MSFFTELQKNINDINNLQRTENGAIGYKSTGKTILGLPSYGHSLQEMFAAVLEKEDCSESCSAKSAILIPKLQRRLFLWFLNTADGTI